VLTGRHGEVGVGAPSHVASDDRVEFAVVPTHLVGKDSALDKGTK